MSEETKAFWRMCRSRAWRDTCHALHIETRERVVIGIALSVIALALIWLFGGKDIVSHELILQTTLTAVIIGAFPLVYIWKLFDAPAAVYADSRNEVIALRDRLQAVSIKRPFMFETIKVIAAGPFGPLQENNYHFMITLCFENRGDEMISFNMKDAYAAVNNRRSPTPAILKGRIVHPREKFTFSLPRIDSVSVPGFPMFVDVFFDAEYDNVPPIKPRISMRKIKYIGNDLKNTEAWTNVVLDENEA